MSDTTPKTAGIAPAQKGALSVLQFTRHASEQPWAGELGKQVYDAAEEIASYHPPTGDQAERHRQLSHVTADFLLQIVRLCPPGPERSTAISRAREAKFWASAAVALEGL